METVSRTLSNTILFIDKEVWREERKLDCIDLSFWFWKQNITARQSRPQIPEHEMRMIVSGIHHHHHHQTPMMLWWSVLHCRSQHTAPHNIFCRSRQTAAQEFGGWVVTVSHDKTKMINSTSFWRRTFLLFNIKLFWVTYPHECIWRCSTKSTQTSPAHVLKWVLANTRFIPATGSH